MNDLTPTSRRLKERAAYYRKRAMADPAQAENYREIAELLEQEAKAAAATRNGPPSQKAGFPVLSTWSEL